VLFLDADERIDADDFAALRLFVERDAVPGSAYGFRVHRMVGDGGDYDRAGLWVYRLFAAEVGQRLPKVKLHLVPVPVSIPRSRWEKTTVRIQHLAGVDEGRRRERLLKYEQADPELRWQSEYQRSILELGRVRPWQRRPPHLPVLADPAQSGLALDLEELDLEAPLLSAIMIARDDAATIERSVRAVIDQECSWSFETIVVVSGSPRTAAVVRRLFDGEVTLIELAEPALPGKARNAGLARARGEYVSFPGSHVELAPGSLEHRIRAHEAGWAMVTGSIFNANKTPAGWAAYFLDHSSALPGRPSAELAGAPAHCSYVREFLLEVGGFPEHVRAGEDTIVNEALWRGGHRAYREQAIELAHRSPCSTPARLVRHHFARGRAFGRILRGDFESKRRGRSPGLLRFLRRYPGRRLASTSSRVADWGGEVRDEYARVRHLVVLGVAAAWVGTCFELALPRPKSAVPKQPRQRHQGESTTPQAEDDLWQGSERAFAALVQKHD
jgi:glycosyltransferase involved in cell wall biosynthesis